MTFYFVRHGQTEANRMRLLAGSGLDYELNDEGRAQAGRLAMAIAGSGAAPSAQVSPFSLSPMPKRLFASQLKRAHQTAQTLAPHLNLNVEV